MAAVMAAACVFNNYLDKEIDSKMARTAKRAIPTGKVTDQAALVYASVLLVVGFTILGVYTNWYVIGLGFISIYSYVVFYGLAKRRTVYGTLVGAIPGAVPPAAGYLAVTSHIDASAALLFLAITLWQMPHFYSIAMYRYKDYKAAGLPVLPVKKGGAAAKKQIMGYILGFGLTFILMFLYGEVGYTYLIIGLAVSVYWILRGYYRASGLSDERWGRRMFLASLIVNMTWCALTALGGRLP
jgi:protoheme IX farnesyltransferase